MKYSQARDLNSVPESWDAVVVGAGPAGAVASYLLATMGVKTLLVDAKSFPRPKVCGGCLNSRAVGLLESVGLGSALDRCAPSPINRLELRHSRAEYTIDLPSGKSVSREVLDATLVEAACEAGTLFLPETRCRVLSEQALGLRTARLTQSDKSQRRIRAKIILACDGLGHPSLHGLDEFRPRVHHRSRIGLGAVVAGLETESICPRGAIRMVLGKEGYVGLAASEQGRLSMAAAVDPSALARADSPATLVAGMLARASLPTAWVPADKTIRGTPPLTQHTRRVSGERLLLVGDAAGYVEPFTGEGMAAAIEGAVSAVSIARRGMVQWHDRLAVEWQNEYARRIRNRQLACRSLAWGLRRPRLTGAVLSRADRYPWIGTMVANWISSSEDLSGIGNV